MARTLVGWTDAHYVLNSKTNRALPNAALDVQVLETGETFTDLEAPSGFAGQAFPSGQARSDESGFYGFTVPEGTPPLRVRVAATATEPAGQWLTPVGQALVNGPLLGRGEASNTYARVTAPAEVGDRPGTFDTGRSLYLPTPTALDAVRAKFAAGASGAARTKVAWVGTSIVAGYGSTIGVTSAPVLLRKFLARRYGTVGTGLVPATNGVNANNQVAPIAAMDDARYAFTGTWSNSGSPRANDLMFHILSGEPGATVTFSSDVAGPVVDIYYFNNSRPFTYSIDGGAAVTVTPTGASALAVTTVTGLADTTHTVKVTVAGTTGNVFLLGIGVRSTTGVEVSNFGYYGSITADWLPTQIGGAFYNGYNVVNGYAPDAVLVQLGANELIHGISGGAATVKVNLTTIVSAFKSAGRPVALVVDPPIESGTVSGWATTYRSVIYAVADEQEVALVDLTHAWRDRASGAALGYYADQWHPTASGSAAMAETVFAALAR